MFLHSIALLIPSRPPTRNAILLANSSSTSREMLEIAADEELRLFRRDIERPFCAASIEYGIFFTCGSRQLTDSPIEESKPAP